MAEPAAERSAAGAGGLPGEGGEWAVDDRAGAGGDLAEGDRAWAFGGLGRSSIAPPASPRGGLLVYLRANSRPPLGESQCWPQRTKKLPEGRAVTIHEHARRRSWPARSLARSRAMSMFPFLPREQVQTDHGWLGNSGMAI